MASIVHTATEGAATGQLASASSFRGSVSGPNQCDRLLTNPDTFPLRESLHQDAPRTPGDTAESGLTFADVPDGLFQLHTQLGVNNNNNNNRNNILGELFPATNPDSIRTSNRQNATLPNQTQARRKHYSLSNSKETVSSSKTPNSTVQPRKPSPGLAARLKALGFGSTNTKSADNSVNLGPHRIGRLSQEQLRQLDENHRNSTHDSIIERRGRPWKGVSAPFRTARIQTDEADIHSRILASETSTGPTSAVEATPKAFLPEIAVAAPLEMDTQKYRLPDHTNGNGTKAQLDTRREHLERSVQSPLSDDSVAPPPPPPKDASSTSTSSDFVSDLSSYFSSAHQRPGSIYTLSRASFANQLAQLTSLQLPDAESLSSKVSAIPTAHAASTALINAAEQIRSWISKASEVIAGLDSEDDVEWAAAGGREGLAEVENATSKFEDLINVYVGAIEELQSRSDIARVPPQDLRRAVAQMDSIINEWANIRSTLKSVKEQVEIAMEWEELWNMVLGDINGEVDELCQLVFEMEERRHKSLMVAAGNDGIDIGDLETISEEIPAPLLPSKLAPPNRLNVAGLPISPSSPGTPTLSQDDSSLLALFARMQPLRASLEFLPMRLSVFEARAKRSFPTACEELEMRREGLDGTYKKLEKDAESLRKELGEDRWVLAFRSAGRQAQKLMESVERSLQKLRDSVDAGHHLTNAPTVSKKVESYEAKKTHYVPAIERVLAIIDKGVKDRFTVNGEILRLHAEVQAQWELLRVRLAETDAALEEIQLDDRGLQLRDSISSMVSNDHSTLGSGRETPGSSPPSSVIMSIGLEPVTPTPKNLRIRSGGAQSQLPQPASRRHSSLPVPATPVQRSASATVPRLSTVASSLPTPSRSSALRTESSLSNRPRWTNSTNTNDNPTSHNFKSLNLTTPSPYAKRISSASRSGSSLTPSSLIKAASSKSPLNRSLSVSPMPEDTPTRTSVSRLSFGERVASPGPSAVPTINKPRFTSSNSMTALGNRRASFQPPRPGIGEGGNTPLRPASSLASGRRSSMLPQSNSVPRGGRSTPQAVAGARSAMNAEKAKAADNKPRWRF